MGMGSLPGCAGRLGRGIARDRLIRAGFRVVLPIPLDRQGF